MKYLSVCSGIEAATVAWHGLNWTPGAFSEIEKFPSAVLGHHYPTVPNWGDMTKFKEWPDADINVLVGGTPCQSFSVAGLRKGLDDPRGNLMLTYLAIANKYRPKWLVWENVPGVLSSNGGRDFGSFLGGLGELGYGFAYRVLDAQYFGVAQRRRRVFVVGYLGDWRRAASVLFEQESLRGDPAPSRETGQGFAADAGERAIPEVCGCLSDGAHNGGGLNGQDAYTLDTARGQAVALPINTQIATRHKALGRGTGFGIGDDGDPAFTLGAAHSHAVAFQQNTRDEVRLMGGDGQIAGALAAQPGMKQQNYVAQPVAIRESGQGYWMEDDISDCMRSDTNRSGKEGTVVAQPVAQQMSVRRLTPRECSILQGFPFDYLELNYADADEAHSAQILHELWRAIAAQGFKKQGWRTGVLASLLTPQILFTGVYVGWFPWSRAEECLASPGSMAGQAEIQASLLQAMRSNEVSRHSPHQRESFRQLAIELGVPMSELPYETPQARQVLRDSSVWKAAQRAWPLRYAFATEKQRCSGKSLNPDGPRYKALGNSMAVPVMRWIGERIQMVEDL